MTKIAATVLECPICHSRSMVLKCTACGTDRQAPAPARLKTVKARAKQLIRQRKPGALPQDVWVRAVFKGEDRQELGTTGIALSDSALHWMHSNGVSRVVLAYLDKGVELFAEAIEMEVTRLELE